MPAPIPAATPPMHRTEDLADTISAVRRRLHQCVALAGINLALLALVTARVYGLL